MPCSDNYPAVTSSQAHRQRTAKLLIWVYKRLGVPIPKKVRDASLDSYCEDKTVIPSLCKALKEMTDSDRDALVYDARSKMSRALANWWERHQEQDKIDRAEARAKAKLSKVRKEGLAKLTHLQRKALGLDYNEAKANKELKDSK